MNSMSIGPSTRRGVVLVVVLLVMLLVMMVGALGASIATRNGRAALTFSDRQRALHLDEATIAQAARTISELAAVTPPERLSDRQSWIRPAMTGTETTRWPESGTRSFEIDRSYAASSYYAVYLGSVEPEDFGVGNMPGARYHRFLLLASSGGGLESTRVILTSVVTVVAGA